jgi:predicted RecB family nuclease
MSPLTSNAVTLALNEKLTQGFSRFGGGSVAKAIARNLGEDWRSEIAVEKCAKMRLRWPKSL